MIKLILGNVGSGKTAFAVREMSLNMTQRKTYTNIKVKLPNQELISPAMIVKKEIISYKKNRKTNEEVPVYKYEMNREFWQSIKEPINVTLDEVHSVMNARRSVSRINIILMDWLALIRRVLGSREGTYGELTLISQLWNRIDIIAREMATSVIYVICHYIKSCRKCGFQWRENSEMPSDLFSPGTCPKCGAWQLKKHFHVIEAYHFRNISDFLMWKEMGLKTHYKRYYIYDIEKYFPLYNTLEWDNLFSMYY